jgi:uncharacterized surface protein with fasciclin (FAS1) repeats
MKKRITVLVSALLALALAASLATAAPSRNIVQTADASPKFDTLVQLAKDAGLAGTLSGKGPYTVFAPTDRAFDKVPDSTLNKLANNRRMLRQVLLYHVVPGKLPAAKVVKRSGAETAQGSRVRFSVRDGKAFVNRSRIVITDIRASNGIVHAINRVLLPPAG